ncbi:MAG: hypothetical protein K0S47_525 [Herbinix sp.]|jgi:hypothetical protein|nr:hypothetical protein [Herbinix sp.]
MKKIIDIVVKLPNSCETSKFPANFASVWMSIEGLTTEVQNSEDQTNSLFCNNQMPNGDCCGRCECGNIHVIKPKLGKRQGAVHNLYAVVSGISLMQLDLSNEEHLMPWWGPNTAKLLDEYDDYIKFTMDFAGYSYERFSRQSEKADIFEAVKRSIDADRPVLMNFGPFYDWFTVTGYDDENGRLYGYDASQNNSDEFPVAEGYEDGMFYLSGWYEEMIEAVVITEKTTLKNTYDDMFQRMICILENMLETGYFKHSSDYLRDNSNFTNYDDEQYRKLAQRIEMFIGLPIDQRPVTTWCFNDLAKVNTLKDKWQYFKRISALYDNTHDICWIAWRMVGAFGTAPADECAIALASPIVRRAIADIIDIVRNNDELVLGCLREMME